MKFLKYSCVLSEATTLLCCCSWKETAPKRPNMAVFQYNVIYRNRQGDLAHGTVFANPWFCRRVAE